MQVAVTVAGGKVEKCKKGAHRGIAKQITINKSGLQHPIYRDKNPIFNSPAFNFDEVTILPNNAKLLSSNQMNKVMAIHFKNEISEIWGIQYHPEITYDKMISLIHFRKDRLIEKKAFANQKEIDNHVEMIENEKKLLKIDARMKELKNWLNYVTENKNYA